MNDNSKYLAIFIDEGRDLVGNLETDLLALERDPGNFEAFKSALRHAHTLKGSSRMVGLPGISKAAHGIENLLEDSEATKEEQAQDLGLVLDVLDSMKEVFSSIEAGGEADLTILPDSFGRQVKAKEKKLAQKKDIEKKEAHKRAKVRKSLARSKDNVAAEDTFGEIPAEASPSPKEPTSSAVRIRLDRLDTILSFVENATVVGKKAIAQARLVKEYYPALASSPLFGSLIEELHQLESLIYQTLGHVVDIRMTPLRDLFGGYKRMVRDLALQLGKEVELIIEGYETELDRNLIDDIKGPLTHVIRNAIDHGIEGPDGRALAKKPRSGRLWIRAYHKPGALVIEVEDDGSGLDADTLRETAVRKGFLMPGEASELSDSEMYHMLCRPGFTTRTSADEISGRGVGMDVVKVCLEKHQGSLSIASENGKYTRFRLFLPKSLSTMRALVVTAQKLTIALPTVFVEKCISASAQRLISRGGLLPYMEERLHVVSLAALMGLDPRVPEGDIDVVILQFRGRRMALAVDVIVNENELLVKDLGSHLQDMAPSVLGITVLGDGISVPILDVRYLHERWSGLEFSCRLPMPKLKKPLRILVVDDAVTSRHVISTILEGMDHNVIQAQDGGEAWNILERDQFDLVVTDLDMPDVDGIELVRRIRRKEQLSNLPVVMVSAQSSDAEVARAYGVGVNAYVPKDRLSSIILKKTIGNLFPEA